jgi:hypothetical protein
LCRSSLSILITFLEKGKGKTKFKKCFRQRSRTQSFFSQKTGACGNAPGPNPVLHKKGACGNPPRLKSEVKNSFTNMFSAYLGPREKGFKLEARFLRPFPFSRKVIKIDNVDLHKLLKEFTAQLAKWRFETFYDCLLQLRPLRDLCQNYIIRSSFAGL